VSQFARDNCVYFEFHPGFCFVKSQESHQILLQETLKDGLYVFYSLQLNLVQKSLSNKISVSNYSNSNASNPVAFTSNIGPSFQSSVSVCVWHYGLGHPSLCALKYALKLCNIYVNLNKKSTVCSACCMRKSYKLPFSMSTTTYSEPLELVHSEVWGRAPVDSILGFRYYILFMDAYSKYTWVYMMKNKSEAITFFNSN